MLSYAPSRRWLGFVSSLLALGGCGQDPAAIRQEAVKHHEAGLVSHRAGEFDAAIAKYDEAIRIDPSLEIAHYDRGNAYASKGDDTQAIVSYDRAIRLDSRDAQFLRARALAKSRQGDMFDAILDARTATDVASAPVDSQLTLSVLQMEAGQHDEAIATCNMILGPGFVEALANRAEAKRLKKDYEGALRDIAAALALSPNHAPALACRGMIAYDQGDASRAIADLDLAVKADGQYAYPWFKLGLIYDAEKNYHYAVSGLSQAIFLAPHIPAYRIAYARFLITCPQADCHDAKIAVEHATKACEQTLWKKADYLDTLAACQADLKDFQAAAKTQAMAIAALTKDSALLSEYEKRRAQYAAQAATKPPTSK